MKLTGLFAVLLLQVAYPGSNMSPPFRPPGDPRLREIVYQADQIVRLDVAAGYQLSVEFAPDEQIETVAVGDSSAWLVTTNQRGSHLFVKTSGGQTDSNMTVITDTRVYLFDLHALDSPGGAMPYTVRFVFPPPRPGIMTSTLGPDREEGEYRMSGDRRLYPSKMGDDGVHTYIVWPEEAALPAIYSVDDRGEERLVNGAMRDGMYVIDTVVPKLTFRIDNRTARARRILPKEER